VVVYDSNRTIVGLKPHRAVEQNDVNVVGVKFLAESVNGSLCISDDFGQTLRHEPDFRLDDEFFSRNAFECVAQEGMSAVKVGSVKEVDAALVSVLDEPFKGRVSHPSVVGLPHPTPHPRA